MKSFLNLPVSIYTDNKAKTKKKGFFSKMFEK